MIDNENDIVDKCVIYLLNHHPTTSYILITTRNLETFSEIYRNISEVKLHQHTRDHCEGDIILNECAQTLHGKTNGKSPGSGGYSD